MSFSFTSGRFSIPSFYFLLITLILVSCSDNNQAGGGTTVETTNGIAGTVFREQDGVRQPVADAQVLLTEQSTLAHRDSLSYITYSDENGNWLFDDLPPGSYTVLTRDSLEEAALIADLSPNSDDIALHLKPTATMRLDLSAMPLQKGDTLGLAGTDIFRVVDVDMLQSESLTLYHLPQAVYSQWILLRDSSSQVFQQDTVVISGDSSVNYSPQWPFEKSFQIRLDILPENFTPIVNFPVRLKVSGDELEDWKGVEEFCILDDSRTPQTFYTAHLPEDDSEYLELWIPLDVEPGEALEWSLLWNSSVCSAQQQNFFPSDWLLHQHLSEQYFSEGEYLTPTLLSDDLGYPETLTLTALVKPDSGVMGGELVSLGNSVGMRVDRFGDVINTYNYSAYNQANSWHIISSGQNYSSNAWYLYTLVVDPAAGRFELYSNGELISQHADAINPIDYSFQGDSVSIGRHAYLEENFFQGYMDEIQIHSSARSAEWIFLQALNLRPPNDSENLLQW